MPRGTEGIEVEDTWTGAKRPAQKHEIANAVRHAIRVGVGTELNVDPDGDDVLTNVPQRAEYAVYFADADGQRTGEFWTMQEMKDHLRNPNDPGAAREGRKILAWKPDDTGIIGETENGVMYAIKL